MAVDALKKEFAVGQQVARAGSMYASGDGLFVYRCTVTRVEGNKVYLDQSKQPLRYPDRVIIIGA